MPRPPMPLTPRAVAFAITLAVAPGMALAQGSAETCPLGAFTCPVVKNDFALCRKNDLLNFYEPGLPTEGNRETSPAQVYGDRFSSPDSKRFHLAGNTALQRLDQLLRADSLTYNADTTAYDAEGHVRYQERGMLFSADSMKGTTTPEYGVADNVQYQLLSSRGNGVASQAVMLDQDRDKLHDVTYSTCDLHNRVWEIEAKTLTMDRDEGIGRAHDVTMAACGPEVDRIFHTVTSRRATEDGVAALAGYEGMPFRLPAPGELPVTDDAEITTSLDTADVLSVKVAALAAHSTQVSVWQGADGAQAYALSNGIAQPLPPAECYVLARGDGDGADADLFGGLA